MSATVEAETVDVSEFIAHDRSLESPAPTAGQGARLSPTALHEEQKPATTANDVISAFSQPQPSLPDHFQFTESPFWKDYKARARKGQDLVVLISDYNNDRGTGKTALSIDLAEKLDQSEEGLIPEKANIAPEELINGYTNHSKQSSLILDEAEAGVGARNAMTRINKSLNKIVSMGRVEEKYLILNMPASNHIDKNLIDLAHYWILVQDRGMARVYKLENNPFEGEKYPSPVQQLEWSDINGNHPVYRALTKEKRERLRNSDVDGEGGDQYVPREEFLEEVEKAEDQARRELRDEIITRALRHPKIDAPQSAIGDICGVSQSHVSNVKKEAERASETPSATGD